MLWNCGISSQVTIKPRKQMAGLMAPFAKPAREAGVRAWCVCLLQVYCFPQRRTRFSCVHSTLWFLATELAQEVVPREQEGGFDSPISHMMRLCAASRTAFPVFSKPGLAALSGSMRFGRSRVPRLQALGPGLGAPLSPHGWNEVSNAHLPFPMASACRVSAPPF